MSSGSSSTDQSKPDTATGEFVANYYEHFSDEDARSYSPETLERRASFHHRIAQDRPAGEAAIDILDENDASVVVIVTSDMPFLVDSVTAELVERNAAIRSVVHPTFIAVRERQTNRLLNVHRVPSHGGVSSGDTAAIPNISHLVSNAQETTHVESWIAVEINRIGDETAAAELVDGLRRVLADVRAAVEDWPVMRRRAIEIAESLDAVPGSEEIDDLQAAKDLLRWLDAGNFTFLGYREYDLVNREGEDLLQARHGTGLGMLKNLPMDRKLQHLTSTGRRKAREKQMLVITKANSRSTVHRRSYLDYIGVKSFDAAGNVDGERRFIGLFTSSAYIHSVRKVPIIRDKVNAVLDRSGFALDSHSGKDLVSILETYPRDELFQISTDDLAATATGILRLQERRRTRLFLRPDVYGRFMSALVFLPRDRYTTGVRLRIENELSRTFRAESIDFEARLSESVLARLFFRIRLPRGDEVLEIDAARLEQRLVDAVRSWSEGIDDVLRRNLPMDEAKRLGGLWTDALPPNYRVDYEVEDAFEDLQRFEQFGLDGGGGRDPRDPILHVYVPEQPTEELGADARVKLYLTKPHSLSQILPYFHNLGLRVLDERPYEITRSDNRTFFLYDLGLKYPADVDPMETGSLLAEAFRAGITGSSESDQFDRLILKETLEWRQVVVLRGFAKYLRQLGNTNSYGFVADTLLANPEVTRALLRLFWSRFDPDLIETDRAQDIADARAALDQGLEQVATLDADRVLRSLSNLVAATLRTNYFQDKPYLSLKFSPTAIDGAPFPRPKYEIWVYSPQVEGVHLRFGEVARGGLRWSDRREDFRTEVLGLVKAQTVKNAVIVPTGAKGGFFPKQLPDPGANRGAWIAAGKDSYRTFIRGLLDITDNLVTTEHGEEVVPPHRVVRHDGDDTYLVVAADKGTAAFSDTANALSAEYGFWLGDAFASGGSVGYDHKAMGITARGAWESVKSHFTELGVDTQSEEITVVGVGDMSGDVFGNGMLRSKHLRLLAAFDHRHIFLDPAPDALRSFDERQRLYDLPRSSWADYDSSLISAGGGVYPRHVKTIPISDQVRESLGLAAGTTTMSPPELLRAILRAPVDLLYNGGIGTYVKASTESHAQVGDKANDAIRVDGDELRVKVIGEGGNLGMTQQGRIEAALTGIILNTDAIDNSAGVDCSDHEVNIKIFIDKMVTAGKLDADERAGFLHSMTDEVARLVLETNVDQNVLLLNDRQRAMEWSPSYERMMDWLEANADLDRALEGLPGTAVLEARRSFGQAGLTSPELAVLAAYAKMELAKALNRSSLADDPWFARTLQRYFPAQVGERFAADLDKHPLKREIICNVVANDMINIGGITFVFRAIEETSVSEAAIAGAFVALREIYELDQVTDALAALPPSFPTEHWSHIYLDMRRLLDRAVRWYVNHENAALPVGAAIEKYKPLIDPLRFDMARYLRGADLERVHSGHRRGSDWGLPEPLAKQWAEQFETYGLLDIAATAERVMEPVQNIAKVYYTLYDRFDVDTLLERITRLPRDDRWKALARAALRDDLYSTVADMTVAVMTATPEMAAADQDPIERVQAWEERNAEMLGRAKNMFAEVNQLEQDDMASLSVALRLLRSIVRR